MPKRGRPLSNAPHIASDNIELFALWNRALDAPHGITIDSGNPQLLSTKLYAARRECGMTIYNHLKLVVTETEVWIVPR